LTAADLYYILKRCIFHKYDALGNVTKSRNPLGESEESVFDLMGNKIKSISPGGKETYYTYDSLGRLIQQRRNGNEAAEIIQNYYDGRGDLIKQIDPLGEIKESQFDAMGRPTLTRTGNQDTGFMESAREYDDAGNLIRESYGLSANEKRGVEYTYDHLGRKIKETDELGNSIFYTYDAAGNLIKKTDKNGVTTSYTYDGLDRMLTQINDKDNEKITNTYDSLGRTNRVEDGTGEYLFRYDQYSNLVQVRNPLEIRQNYTYDKLGRVTSYIEEQSGIRNQKLSYSYDKAGRLSTLYTDIANIDYNYDKDGKLLSEANSTTNEITKYSYDLFSRMTQKSIWQKDKLQSSQKYGYDLLGRKTEEIIGSDYTLYFYDALGRLGESIEGGSEIEAAYSKGKITSYSYDPYSNLTEKSIWQDNGRLKESYIYNGNNQLTSKKVDDKTELFSYDDQGNLVEKKELLPGGTYFIDYTYDGKNRLAGVNNNDEIQSSYTYRYDGLRFSKTVDGDTRYFSYNGGNITSELTSGGTYNYYRGLFMIGMTTPQQEKFYYTQNNKGDIIGLKDATGNSVKSYQYDPFGNQYKDTEKLSFEGVWEQETNQVYNPFGYCGEYFDEETGFVYLRGRYYDPATERFITEDPMKDGGNWYAYCGNDPVNRIDPSGYRPDEKGHPNLNGSKPVPVTVTLADGTPVNATMVNGVTTLPNGKRPSFGDVVHTPSGDYMMTGSGKGKSPKDIARDLANGSTLWDALGIKQPTFDGLNPPGQSIYNRAPDFYVITLGLGTSKGGTTSLIVDRNQNEYFSAGGYKGAPSGVSFSVMAFWTNTPEALKEEKLRGYLTGKSATASGGAGVGAAVLRPKDLTLPTSVGGGVCTPQWSISGGYTWELPNATPRPEYAKPH
jgi:RHS repeat-associated protein